MALRSDDRKLSFEILSRSMSLEEDEALFFYRSNSDPIQNGVVQSKTSEKKQSNRKKRKNKGSKKKKTIDFSSSSIPEDPIDSEIRESNISECTNGLELNRQSNFSVGSVCTVVTEPDFPNVRGEGFNFGELRQRSVGFAIGGDDAASRVGDNEKEESGVEVSSAAKQPNVSVVSNKLETAESLDWKRLMAEDPNCEPIWSFLIASLLNVLMYHYKLDVIVYNAWLLFCFFWISMLWWCYVLPLDMCSVDKSPLKYFMEEMENGNSLRSTTTIGNEKERERVYDTIFRLPWRCELVIFGSPFMTINKNLNFNFRSIRVLVCNF